MEKRAVFALVLCGLLFLAFSYFNQKVQPPHPEKPGEAKPAAQAPAPQPAPAETPAARKPASLPSRAPAPSSPTRTVAVDTPLYKAVFTDRGAQLTQLELKNYWEAMPFTPITGFSLGPVGFEVMRYHDPKKAQTPLKELVRVPPGQELPLGLSWQDEPLTQVSFEVSPGNLTLKPGETATLKFTGVGPGGLRFTKTYTFHADTYRIDLAVSVSNPTAQPQKGNLDLFLTGSHGAPKDGPSAAWILIGSLNGALDKNLKDIKVGSLKEPKAVPGKVDWAALEDGYFLTAVAPLNAPNTQLLVKAPPDPAGFLGAILTTPVASLPPGQEAKLDYAVYFGPKDLDRLKAINLGLDQTVDFGWFSIMAKPMLQLLKFFNRFFHNYGWSIIALTVLIRLIFLWPNHKSYKSMKDMQKLQPRVAELREKYKNDKEAMNRELMALYRTFKVNPLGGCLPMVLQLPVFIALYNVLAYAIEVRHATFLATLPFTDIVWLADLSTKDPLLITPIIMGATMFIQQKMSPAPGDPTQAKMMMFLPLVFTFMFLNFASGLVLYWLVNNVLSIAQQHYTNKYLI